MPRFFALLLAWLLLPAQAAPTLHHELSVSIDPAQHSLRVQDRLHIPAELVNDRLRLALHADLSLQATPDGVGLVPLPQTVPGPAAGAGRETDSSDVPVKLYRLHGAEPGRALVLTLAYAGRIHNAVRQPGADPARSFAQSSGLIDERGVYLAGSTHWVPQAGDTLLTYTLRTTLPAGWKAVSQGERSAPDTWTVATPTQEVHLIAAAFTEYTRDAGRVQAQAFLRKPDAALAARYLETTAQYLAMYEALLGPYPYSKFALVENFWETGFGMPSFTLLGEQVIRLPFILHSSYPHELLHNWWGNGVFVDVRGGNWCEGLTAYLADHLVAEQHGQGAAHRRELLQRVSDYVTAANDFPLSHFAGRRDAVTEAIGYGRAAMLFEMLRNQLGDAAFVNALRRFYAAHRFQRAGWDDIRQSFEAEAGSDLKPFFEQWVNHAGAPMLELQDAVAQGRQLQLTLAQVQGGRRFALDVPVFVQTAQGVHKHMVKLAPEAARTQVTLELPAPALRVEVDPLFQIYRRLSPLETAPTLSKAFGAAKVLIIIPAGQGALYASMLAAWARDGVQTVEDSELARLPADRAVWVLGTDNRFAATVAAALPAFGAALEQGSLQVGDTRYAPAQRSLVAAVRHPQNPALVLVYASASSEAAASALARKLPHYGKASWLVFAGDAADKQAQGEWASGESPLARNLAPGAAPIALPPRPALAAL